MINETLTSPGTVLTPRAIRGRKLPRSVAYALAGYIIGLGLFASVTPSPLYGTYSRLWHFSPVTLTLVYATYAFGVLVTLLVAGRVSDDVGRRPVMLAALALLMASTVLYIVASSVAWLFVARGLQGLATGAAVSTASAALLDLHKRHDATGVGLTNGVASTAGTGLGILVSAAAVEINWEPRVLPYLVLLGLFTVAFAGVYWMSEPVTNRRPLRLTFERPTIPAVVRWPFLIASLTTFSSWSIAGLFFSIGPELGSHLLNTTNTVISNIGIVAFTLTGAVSQLALGRFTARIQASAGSVALATGALLLCISTASDSSALYLLGSIIGGVGWGVAYLGGLRTLLVAIPAEQRAAVMSAFYVVAYASLSVPAIVAGLVVTHLGLQTTFETFSLVVVAIALVVAAAAPLVRPTQSQLPAKPV